jgi:hypothetical protein
MKRRYRLPPPVNAGYRALGVIEVSAGEDQLNAGKPAPPAVPLTPVGPAVLVIDVPPEDESRAALIRYFEKGRGIQSRLREAGSADVEYFHRLPSDLARVSGTEANLLRLLGDLYSSGVIERVETVSPWDAAEYYVDWFFRAPVEGSPVPDKEPTRLLD